MHPSNKVFLGVVGASLLASAALWEGEKYDPYWDLAGILTVCNGYTGKDIVKTKRYTKEECQYLLKKELDVHGRGVLKCVTVPLKRHQYDAYTLFAYNVGVNNFCSSTTVLKRLNAGNYQMACDGLLKWSYVKGKYVQGLNNRRQYERKMCMGEMN